MKTVIYYGDITSGRSLIQARGRVRKEGGKFIVIYYQNSGGNSCVVVFNELT
jgi:hypothetical protein